MLPEDEGLDLKRYIAIFLSYWWLIVTIPIAGGIIGYYYSERQDRIYEAGSRIMVWPSGSSPVPTASSFQLSELFAETYQELVLTADFLDTVEADEDIPFSTGRLKSIVSAVKESSPPVLHIKSRHTDPAVAAVVAQKVADLFVDYVVQLRLAEIARFQSVAASQGIVDLPDLVSAQTSVVGSLSVIERAEVPGAPVLPDTNRNVLLGSMLGVVIALAAVALMEGLRTRLPSPEEIETQFAVNMLGVVSRWPRTNQPSMGSPDLVLIDQPDSGYAESFRQIRSSYQFSTIDRAMKRVMVTSAGPGEGKSTVVSNFAVSLALIGRRVLLIDCDLRRPSIHTIFSLKSREPGLTDFLLGGDDDYRGVVRTTEVEGLDVITCGTIPPNPAEVLESNGFRDMLLGLEDSYDVILLDCPPTLVVADASAVARSADGIMIVLDYEKGSQSEFKSTLAVLSNTSSQIIGVIVNKLQKRRIGYNPYYYYYSRYQYYASDYSSYSNGTNGSGAKQQGILGLPNRILTKIRRD